MSLSTNVITVLRLTTLPEPAQHLGRDFKRPHIYWAHWGSARKRIVMCAVRTSWDKEKLVKWHVSTWTANSFLTSKILSVDIPCIHRKMTDSFILWNRKGFLETCVKSKLKKINLMLFSKFFIPFLFFPSSTFKYIFFIPKKWCSKLNVVLTHLLNIVSL